MKKIFFLLIFVILATSTYAQSIGATPDKTVSIKTNTPTAVHISVSQGSEYPEKITITGSYRWLTVKEPEFTLDAKQQKSVELTILARIPGTYRAKLKICGSPLTPEGAVLSTTACTTHALTVLASLDLMTRAILIGGGLAIIILFLWWIAHKKESGKKRRQYPNRYRPGVIAKRKS
jgi:hypothetical protein